MANLPLFISHAPDLGRFSALEYGRCPEGQLPDWWRPLSEEIAYLHPGDHAPAVGFSVCNFATFDPEAAGMERLWDEPLFDAPVLGLHAASAGEIIVAAKRHFGRRPSLNRIYFDLALGRSGEEALDAWRTCLESGDPMAHHALGYELLKLGRIHEAYLHLRHYAEIAPNQSWNWCWYGKAAEALGELDEARQAYARAIELEEAGDLHTDAEELLGAPRVAGL